MNRLLETEALQHSFKYCTTLKKSHTLIIQHMYLKNKLIVDALLWCDWFPFSLSHLLYFSFIFITLIHIQLLLAQRKDVTVRSPKTKIRSPKQAMFTTVRYNYCRQCTLCLLQQYKWNTVNIQLPGLIIQVPYRSNCRTILDFFISSLKNWPLSRGYFCKDCLPEQKECP